MPSADGHPNNPDPPLGWTFVQCPKNPGYDAPGWKHGTFDHHLRRRTVPSLPSVLFYTFCVVWLRQKSDVRIRDRHILFHSVKRQ